MDSAEKERYDRAEKIAPDAYEGWVFWEDHGDDEGYFVSVAGLLSWCKGYAVQPPAYVFACIPMTMSMNAEWIIQDALEEHHEDAGDSISQESRDELQALLDAWCKKQTVKTWFVDRQRVVILDGQST